MRRWRLWPSYEGILYHIYVHNKIYYDDKLMLAHNYDVLSTLGWCGYDHKRNVQGRDSIE